LADLSHRLPLEEVVEPVWRMPRSVQLLVVVLSLAGLVGGVRVLDAQIAARDIPPDAVSSMDPATAPELSTDVSQGWTGLLVETPPPRAKHQFLPVTVSGYCSLPELTDDSPHLTATASPARPGTIALSRDLIRRFTTGAPFDFGDRVLIPGMGIYVVEDTMHPRWTRKADIWFHDLDTARRWGVRHVYLSRVEAGTPLLVAPQWHS
jgi:3D (Asp-Asp-Asp) domain-containing protein